WKKFKPGDRDEFVKLYRTLLENVYIARLLAYQDETVEFYKEQEISETKAEVFSRVITKSAKIPINYKMIKKSGAWGVYDVIIEGVSMTKNYRSQFRSMLRKKTPEELLKILRAKTAGKS
ncbi:MAG: ABC transporter substrate-binding protein, partial [Deltaproteobacteria bacterium]|nr:ABC transporter substrate-binding protein [Deltaproteobacteria bacterium]